MRAGRPDEWVALTGAGGIGNLAGCRRLVVSPHLDDGVLSCGGALALWAASGEQPCVVTVCAGRPVDDVTDFARFQHARWGKTADIVGLRRDEDRRALAILGATPAWLPYLDCIYRGERYTSETALFGPVALDEQDLIELVAVDLATLWKETDEAIVVMPLGLGNHVDHQIVRAAGDWLGSLDVPVVWYEDFPYAARPGGAEQLAALTAGLRAETADISEVLDRKIAAIAAYASQVPVLFGAAEAMPAAVRAYAEAVGGGTPAERYWRSSGHGM